MTLEGWEARKANGGAAARSQRYRTSYPPRPLGKRLAMRAKALAIARTSEPRRLGEQRMMPAWGSWRAMASWERTTK